MEETYVAVLAEHYEGQLGTIVADAESKPFSIQRGTKQGDPLSPCLFNAVLEGVFRKIQESWRKRGFGIQVADGLQGRLCNLRFADDLLIVASSLRQLKIMVSELFEEASKVGLEIHYGKTKILNNRAAGNASERFVEITGDKIDI